MKFKIFNLLIAFVAILPVLAFADEPRPGENIFGFLNFVKAVLAQLVPIIVGIALVTFLWGIIKYVVAKSDEEQKEARHVMLYGIIVLFVMVSVWGLVGLLGRTLGLNYQPPVVPGLPESPYGGGGGGTI